MQNVIFEFEGGKMIIWEGCSCNILLYYNRGRGFIIYGLEGFMMLDRNIYVVYDKNGKVIKEVKEKEVSVIINIVGVGGLDVYYMDNFLGVICEGKVQNFLIDEGYKSVLFCYLGNMV